MTAVDKPARSAHVHAAMSTASRLLVSLQMMLTVLLAMPMTAAHAGFFGGPSEEELAKRRQEQALCAEKNSWAYCVLSAGGNLRTLRDVEVPTEVYGDITSKGQLVQASVGVTGISVGAAQLAGTFPTVISRTGFGTLNVLGGLIALTGSTTEGLTDKMIAFLPESEAADAVSAHQKIEQAYVDAYIKSIPGVTSAVLETFSLNEKEVATSYVLKGGECDVKRCVLWSPTWGKLCYKAPCERSKMPARLVENGFLGNGKYWVPIASSYIEILDSPKSFKQIWSALKDPMSSIGGFKTKLELMQTVSANLPAWASFFMFQRPDRGVPYPVVVNSGNQFLLIKPHASVPKQDADSRAQPKT